MSGPSYGVGYQISLPDSFTAINFSLTVFLWQNDPLCWLVLIVSLQFPSLQSCGMWRCWSTSSHIFLICFWNRLGSSTGWIPGSAFLWRQPTRGRDIKRLIGTFYFIIAFLTGLLCFFQFSGLRHLAESILFPILYIYCMLLIGLIDFFDWWNWDTHMNCFLCQLRRSLTYF
jgi:hypothetical protein